MRKLFAILAILSVLFVMLVPTALADTADYSNVETGFVWGDGINGSFTHNTWYSDGRHWVMYYEYDIATPGIHYASTADYGTTWDDTLLAGTQSTLFRGFACWYDESQDTLHYARVDIGNSTDNTIYYRAGYPNADGTITWIAAEVAVEAGTGVGGMVASITIACDELGYPYIAWVEQEGNATTYWVEVSDSDNNDGTWVEINADAWEEFDAAGAASYGHDYDTLYGTGNWTAIAVNLCPVNNTGEVMQLSWSIEDTGADALGDAGIDSTIYDKDTTTWGNLSWIVPIDNIYGLAPITYTETAFSCYDIGAALYFVYSATDGDIYFNVKSQIQDWDNINGIGNWTKLLDSTIDTVFPAIAGYDNKDTFENIIVLYHDIDSLWYDTRIYGGNFTGTWTKIWDIDDESANPAHLIFLHSLQYKYADSSLIGFAWDWGTLAWGNGTQTGTLSYWWLDHDGTDAGEFPQGYYYVAPTPTPAPGMFGSISNLVWIVCLILCGIAIFRILALLDEEASVPRIIFEAIGWLFATIIVATMIAALD